MTKDEVRREHVNALARMDEDQIRALKRINRAFREGRFTNTSFKEVLEIVFEEEAQERSAPPQG